MRGMGSYQANTLYGELMYMAPEAALDRAISPQMDIYSLGLLMYEILVEDIETVVQTSDQGGLVNMLMKGWRPPLGDRLPARIKVRPVGVIAVQQHTPAKYCILTVRCLC